jgi:outer membrane lipoprotein-sorting protein
VRRSLRVGFTLAGLGLAAHALSQTADELIAKNIEARGGLEKIRAIQSMRLTGTLSVGGTTMPSVLEVKRPNKTRWEFKVNGQTAVQAYDGTEAWALAPFAGKSEPERLSPEDTRDMELQADMDGPLVDYSKKGYKVEAMGMEKVGDRDAWRLRVTFRNGDAHDLYLDLKTHLQILSVAHRTIQGKDVEVRTEIDDYREVGGVLLPCSYETTARGASQAQSVRFQKIELNVPIEDSRFVRAAVQEPSRMPQATPTRTTSPPSGKSP